MVHVKNYESVAKFVKVMKRKLWFKVFFGHGVLLCYGE